MNLKKFLKIAPAVAGVVGGVAAQGAVVAGQISPKAGAALTGVALISVSLSESILKFKSIFDQIDSEK